MRRCPGQGVSALFGSFVFVAIFFDMCDKKNGTNNQHCSHVNRGICVLWTHFFLKLWLTITIDRAILLTLVLVI